MVAGLRPMREGAHPVTMIDSHAIDRFLAAEILGDAPAWPTAWADPAVAAEVRNRIEAHGIAYALASRAGNLDGWPEAVAGPVREEARLQAMWEASHHAKVGALVEALSAAGVASVLLKGTALAYTVYSDPAERRRGDTDLLVRETDLAAARAVLGQSGFQCHTTFGMQAQEEWTARTGHGFAHTVDLHWQVLDALPLQHVLTVEEVFSAAVPVPRLAESARASAPAHTVLHCALNQAWHRHQGYFIDDERVFQASRLVWARDIDLLCRDFSEDDWHALRDLAVDRGVPGACLAALDHATALFATPMPAAIRSALVNAGDSSRADRFLRTRNRLTGFTLSLAAAPGAAAKVRYVLENLFPPRAHMARTYRVQGGASLLFAHLRRLAGLPLRLVRSG